MHAGMRYSGPEALKAQLHDGQEIALLDAREEATHRQRIPSVQLSTCET
jgi:hypothetical protein